MVYKNYSNIGGDTAKTVSLAMGIDEPFGSVEVREASDHSRLSAHGKKTFKEVLIFKDRSLEVISIDCIAEEAIKTRYDSEDGSITTSKAAWNNRNGYKSDYVQIKKQTDQKEIVRSEWEKYNKLLFKSHPDVQAIMEWLRSNIAKVFNGRATEIPPLKLPINGPKNKTSDLDR